MKHIIRAVHKYHKIRKTKESSLPPWKAKWNNFNEVKLGWLERFVDRVLPWLVLVLLAIILGELSKDLNVYEWVWLSKVSEFFDANRLWVEIIDRIIILFFVIDLYFNFFKKRTVWSFIKTSFLDILAVAPLGLLVSFARIEETQQAIHLSKISSTEAILKEERMLSKIASLAKVQRVLRLNRLSQLVPKSIKRPKSKRKR